MADGLLSSALGFIDRQKQAAKAGIGLLASNPQEWLTQTTARYLPTRAEEQQYRAVQQAGGDITQTPYYQKLFDLAQFQSSIKASGVPSAVATPSQQALNEAQKNATQMLGLPPDNTPMDRAKALNFIAPGYHGTVENVTSFNPAFRGSATGAPSAKKAFFAASKPQVSTGYSLLGEGREATAIQRELAAAEKARDWNKVEQLTEQYENVVLGNRNVANKISDQRFEAEKDFGNVLDKYGVVQDYYLNKPALGDATTESAMMSRLAVRDQAYQQALSKLPNKINQQKLWADFEKANGGSVLWNTLDEYEAIANKISSKNKKLGDLYRATHDGRWETMPEFQKDPKALAELNKAYNQLRSLDTQYYNLDVPSGANVMPLLINTQGFKVKDFKGSHYRDETYNDLIKEAAASKMPGVLMRNTFDPGQKAYNEITDVFAVIDPSRIRSRFAAFDPARIKESDLLAAGIPIGLIGSTQVELPKKQEKKPTKK